MAAEGMALQTAFQVPVPLPELDARYVDLTSPSNMDAFVYVKIPFSIYVKVLKYLESTAHKDDKDVIKGGWSSEEDEKLMRLVETFGARGWNQIAQHLPGRLGKQCRERYINHLDPRVSKEKWTAEEDLSIMAAYRHFGPQWSKISKMLSKPRTANATKNHWNSSLKKIYQETYGDLNDEEVANDPAAQMSPGFPSMTSFMQQMAPMTGLMYAGAPMLGYNGFNFEVPGWPHLPAPANQSVDLTPGGSSSTAMMQFPNFPLAMQFPLAPSLAHLWDAESAVASGPPLPFPPLPAALEAEEGHRGQGPTPAGKWGGHGASSTPSPLSLPPLPQEFLDVFGAPSSAAVLGLSSGADALPQSAADPVALPEVEEFQPEAQALMGFLGLSSHSDVDKEPFPDEDSYCRVVKRQRVEDAGGSPVSNMQLLPPA